MPMDGVMLGCIVRELNDTLKLGRIDKISQPERDEVDIFIRCVGANRQLLLSASAGNARAHISTAKKGNPIEPPSLCMLMRKHLLGGRFTQARQIDGDRILEINIEHLDELGDRALFTIECEFMGKHSNIMLLNNRRRIVDCARHITEDISRVREVLPGLPYEKPPAQDKIPYDALEAAQLQEKLSAYTGFLHKALAQNIGGLSTQTARELALRAAGDEEAVLENLDILKISASVARLLKELPQKIQPRVLYAEDGSPVDVVPFPYLTKAGLRCEEYPTLSEAMDAFFAGRDIVERIKQKSASLHRVLKNNIERCEKKLALQEEALGDSEHMEEYRVNGELLMANLYMVKKGTSKVLLPNYYDPEMKEIEIPLDVKLSPGQNAQRYFKLYQKARNAKQLAQEQKDKTLEELNYLEGQMENLSFCGSEAELNEIREELERLGYVNANRNRHQIKKLPPSQPLRFISSTGIVILVGKNNVQNDKLTQSAQLSETWLHVKDIPGSHVIIVSNDPDDRTLLEAAHIAAHFSKGRGSSMVPVDYTQRRYVKKPSGAKPGFVIYTHQRTLFVTPVEEDVMKLLDKEVKP